MDVYKGCGKCWSYGLNNYDCLSHIPGGEIEPKPEPFVQEDRGLPGAEFAYRQADLRSRKNNWKYILGSDDELLSQVSEHDRIRLKRCFKQFDKHLMEKAVHDIIEYMKSCGMEAGPRSIEDVLSKVSDSATSKAKKWLWEDKREMVMDPMFYEYVSWYLIWSERCNWIEYHTESDKEELLPIKKIEEGKARTFIYQGAYQWFIDSIFLGKMNEAIENTPICRAGWTPVAGGIDDIIAGAYEKFGKDFFVVKGDARKYDFSQWYNDVVIAQRIAVEMYKGTEEGRHQVWLSYERQKEQVIKLLTGCVVKLGVSKTIQTSGRFDTTCGNSRRHFRILVYSLYRCGAKSIFEIMQNMMIYICSDDHLFICRRGWEPGERFKDYEFRSTCYAEGGILLKDVDDLVTCGNFQGQKWAGVRCRSQYFL